MDEELYRQWAANVIIHNAQLDPDDADDFCKQVERHDAKAADLLRLQLEATTALADHLASTLAE